MNILELDHMLEKFANQELELEMTAYSDVFVIELLRERIESETS